MFSRAPSVLLSAHVFGILLCLASMGFSATDSSFGTQGISTKDFGFGDDAAYATIVQSDGKILIAGYTNNGADNQLFVARYDESGQLDSDFHAGGVFSYGIGGENFVGRDVYVATDGKIIVTATGGDTAQEGFVLQLDEDGYLDKSFGTDGIYSISLAEGSIDDLHVASAKNSCLLILASVINENATPEVEFIKLTADGSIVSSFGDNGTQKITTSSSFYAKAVTYIEDAGYYLAGYTIEDDSDLAAVIKVTEDGALDTSFGDGGLKIITESGTGSVVNAITPDAENDVLWLGGAINSDQHSDAFIGKLNTSGQLDTAFGNAGIQSVALDYNTTFYGVAPIADGGVIAAGSAHSEDERDIFLFSASASTSTTEDSAQTDSTDSDSTTITFSANLVDVANSADIGYAIAANSQNEFYVAGSSSNGENLDVSLLKVTSNGTLTETDSTAETDSTSTAFTVFTLPVSKISLTGATTGGTIAQNAQSSCNETCTATCSATDSSSTCYSDCYSTCISEFPTITLRGVCYSTSSKPTYDTTDSESTTTSSSSSTSTTSSTDTTSTSLFPTGNLLSAYIVHSGWTEDGSGSGTYESDIADITPGMKYYVRAFAVLSDSSVVYGNERTFTAKDACFIATAAYGSIFADEVRGFRMFRDKYLIGTPVGEKIVAIYYKVSPPLAAIIRDHEWLRFRVRLLLYPLYLMITACQAIGFLNVLIHITFIGILGIAAIKFCLSRDKVLN